MAFSLTIPSFSNTLAELDGQISGTNLFTVVRSAIWESGAIVRSYSNEGRRYVFFGKIRGKQEANLYFETLRSSDRKTGLPNRATLTLQTSDRIFGSAEKTTVEHTFWLGHGNQPCAMGVREYTNGVGVLLRTPIYGVPQGYVVRPDAHYSWNGFYAEKLVRRSPRGKPIKKPKSNEYAMDKKKAAALLCFDDGAESEIFRAIAYLTAATFDYIGENVTVPFPNLYAMSERFAEIVCPPHTYWGD